MSTFRNGNQHLAKTVFLKFKVPVDCGTQINRKPFMQGCEHVQNQHFLRPEGDSFVSGRRPPNRSRISWLCGVVDFYNISMISISRILAQMCGHPENPRNVCKNLESVTQNLCEEISRIRLYTSRNFKKWTKWSISYIFDLKRLRHGCRTYVRTGTRAHMCGQPLNHCLGS